MTASTYPPAKPATRAIGLRPRMVTFRRLLVIVTVLIHIPFAGAVYALSRRVSFPFPREAAMVAGAVGVALFSGRMRAGVADKRGRSSLVLYLFDLPYYVHWCACLFTIIPAVLESIALPFVEGLRSLPLRVPTSEYLYTYALGVVVCGYGILIRRRWFVVRELDVSVDGLDPVFDGFRIAHLSDLHIGTHAPKRWGDGVPAEPEQPISC